MQCCSLQFQLAPFHTEIGKPQDLESMSPNGSAVALGLTPEPPEQARLADACDSASEPFLKMHEFVHPRDGLVTGYLGYNPDIRCPRLEQSTLRTWLTLREKAATPEGLTVSEALEMRGLIAWLAHCTVQYTNGFGPECALPGLIWDPRFVYNNAPAPERMWSKPSSSRWRRI